MAKTQNQMVLEHLRTHGSINLVTAYNEYGIAALHPEFPICEKQDTI